MAANLARAGYELSVYTRTREKADRLRRRARTPRRPARRREAAEGASTVITMVADAPEVEEVLLGEDGAVHGAAREGALAIDMSTIAPTAARAVGERLDDDGVAFLEAPVSGSRPKAEDGTLTIMVGGEEADFERARPLLRGDGRADRARGPARARAAGEAAHQHDGSGPRGGAGGVGARGGEGGNRPRRVPRGGRRQRRELDRARPEGKADVRARLHPASSSSSTC